MLIFVFVWLSKEIRQWIHIWTISQVTYSCFSGCAFPSVLAQPCPVPACPAWFLTCGIGELLLSKENVPKELPGLISSSVPKDRGSHPLILQTAGSLKPRVLALLLAELLSFCPFVLSTGGIQEVRPWPKQQTGTCLQLPGLFGTAQIQEKWEVPLSPSEYPFQLFGGSGCVGHCSLKAQNRKNFKKMFQPASLLFNLCI